MPVAQAWCVAAGSATLRGTAHNPDTYFQARETVNPYYAKVPGIVQKAMDHLAKLTGRPHRLFRYAGHPEAERVVVAIGSAVEVLDETAAFHPGLGVQFDLAMNSNARALLLDDVAVSGAVCASGDAYLSVGTLTETGGGNYSFTVSSPPPVDPSTRRRPRSGPGAAAAGARRRVSRRAARARRRPTAAPAWSAR